VEGLTAYYDENAHCLLRQGFPLQKLFGGCIKEIKMINSLFDLKIEGLVLPAHLWQGTILKSTALQVGLAGGETIAVRNKYGKGEVLWVPSMLGLGARLKGNYSPLIQLLERELKTTLSEQSFIFKSHQPNMLMKTLKSGDEYLSIIINKSKDQRIVAFQTKTPFNNAQILFADKKGSISSGNVKINSEETMVIKWQ